MEEGVDPYAEIAELYDLEHAGYDEDLDLYRNVAMAVGDPILELGCGTGRVLVPLAEEGHRVTGLDLSGPMLERARSAVEAVGVGERVGWHRGPMTEADQAAGGPFGVVLVPLNGLLHLGSAAEQRKVLAAVRRALDPRGQLVLDLLNPTPEVLRGFEAGVVHEGNWRREDGAWVDKFAARRVSPARQMIETELWYDLIGGDGSLRRVRTAYPLRYVQAAELALMLEVAGFVEWQMYGSYELDPYEDGSERLVVLAEATAS